MEVLDLLVAPQGGWRFRKIDPDKIIADKTLNLKALKVTLTGVWGIPEKIWFS